MQTARSPLLVTKTRVPRLPLGFVPRPRLARKLIDALRHGMVLLSAQAGYGKTTLLAEALRESRMPVGWLSLDDGDNEPGTFWLYLISALQSVDPQTCGPLLAALVSPEPPPTRWMLTALVNALSTREDECALVLDDYQVIASEPVNEGITFLVEHLPSCLHLLIASRVDPPLPLARWRARGALVELKAEELAFTVTEAFAFLRQNSEAVLDEKGVAALHAGSEGWIAGLKMAALGRITAFSGANRFITEYLAEEVLSQQPARVREFLLETSILERLCGPLCDAVTGQVDGQAMLGQLESANLFLTALDEERRWYRYHQLFADAMRSRLAAFAPGREPRLHRRASDWYEQQGFTDEAIEHALRGGDGERAVALLEGAAPRMLGQGQAARLLRYASRIPESLLRCSPWLCVGFAWAALMANDQGRLLPMLSLAIAALSGDPAGLSAESRANLQRTRGHLLCLQSFVARAQGDTALALSLSEEASRQLPGDEPGDRVAHAVNSMNLAGCYEESGDITKAVPLLEELAAAGRTGGISYAALAAQAALAEIEMQLSRLDRAAEICREAIAQGARWSAGLPIPGAALAYVVQGRLRYERNDLEGAAASLRTGVELGEMSANGEPVLKGTLYMAELAAAQGNDEVAGDFLRRAGDCGPWVSPPAEFRQLSAWKCLLDLRRGDIAVAMTWAREQERSLPVSELPRYDQEQTWLTLVRVKLATGDAGDLHAPLEAFIQNAERQARTSAVIKGLILAAMAQDQIGEPADAGRRLARALWLAEPAGYVRTFVDEGPSLARLLQRIAAEGAGGSYVSKLLEAMPAGARGQVNPGAAAVRGSVRVEALSEREREVLRLIAAGKSNSEIALELFLAIGTVKKHINNIFGKLGAESRTRAVARARELRIL